MNKSLEATLYGQSRDNFSGGGGGKSQRGPFAVLSDGSMPVTIISNTEGANVGTTFLHLDDIQLIKVGSYSAAVMIAANPTDTAGDRWRNNGRESVLSSASRTATINSDDITNYNHKGGHLVINVTAVTGAASITGKIQAIDPVSGTYYTIAETGPISSTGINILKIYPGIQPVSNGSFSDILPRDFRVRVEHDTGDSITYSAGLLLVV